MSRRIFQVDRAVVPMVFCLLMSILATCDLKAQYYGGAWTVDRQIPVVYGTDLFHPHDDPDDHVDLATLFAMRELEIKCILLDLGLRQVEKPGRVPMEQMFALTGRRVPYGIGLGERLRSPDDKGLDQPEQFQAAVRLFLKTLQESDEPVRVLLTGSVRDLAAAFNREPDLVREKVESVHINIGNSTVGGTEWNVELDPQAYRGVMASGLPIYWYPCSPFDVEESSFWLLDRFSAVFGSAPRSLQNFFLYMLLRVHTDELQPMGALTADLWPYRKEVWERGKGMWCLASFIQVANRRVIRTSHDFPQGSPGRIEWLAAKEKDQIQGELEEVFGFVPARVELDEHGKPTLVDGEVGVSNIQMIRVRDRQLYTSAMTSCLRRLLSEFTVTWPLETPEAPADK